MNLKAWLGDGGFVCGGLCVRGDGCARGRVCEGTCARGEVCARGRVREGTCARGDVCARGRALVQVDEAEPQWVALHH